MMMKTLLQFLFERDNKISFNLLRKVDLKSLKYFTYFMQYELNKNTPEYIDKYHTGKRDHTFWRSWTIEKFGIGYAVSYLLLR